MHFSVPDTEERADEAGITYVAYNIHVNGAFHCRVRYSQLHALNEQLKKDIGSVLPFHFPPKRLLSLTTSQVEQRREQLERYIQCVSQDATLGTSEVFHDFLRRAQQETQQVPTEDVHLVVSLPNGHLVELDVRSTDRTEQILQAALVRFKLSEELLFYFALFLTQQHDGHISFIRKLQEFELPYISITSLKNSDFNIVLRKSYWDTAYDEDVMEDRVGLDLLYIQAATDIDHGWILASKEQHKQLQSLQEKGSKKEYIRRAQTLKYYGYIQFDPCITDFPEKGCKVIVSAGNKELNFRVQLPNDQVKEGSFKVTRMRCWRVTSCMHTTNGVTPTTVTSKMDMHLELAFEYLMSKDKLQWISISSQQAIMMSICLQSMVDELMLKKSGGKIKKPTNKNSKALSNKLENKGGSLFAEQVQQTPLAAVGFRKSGFGGGRGGSSCVGNDAFEGIGDDDL
uniref:sorting nexin-17-like n=1 Tax=Myxine glutinosa TaxID=7769 RepID=UPI00358F1423